MEKAATPPPLRLPAKPSRWPVVVVALLLACALAVLYAFNPVEHAFYPKCQLYVWSGVLCPGCGCLRAAHALLHGHVVDAMRFNLMLVLAVAVAGAHCARGLMRNSGGAWPGLPAQWVYRFVALAVVYTVIRNIPIEPFSWLAP